MLNRRLFGKGRLRAGRGFTMIEVIAVLIILAIASAVVISRGMATNDVNLQAEFDTLKGHLRFAQYRAMNDLPGIQYGISFGSSSSYTLVRVPADATINLILPGESSATHNFAPISATAGTTVLFNDWGSPSINSLTFGGKTITITANTGFIP